jgi:hypothetical protein
MPPAPDVINCPRCAQQLVYVTSKSDAVHVYVCTEHGEYVLFRENGDSFLCFVGLPGNKGRADWARP